MSPSGDMSTPNGQYQSFSLANMVPQDANNNQNLWEGVESSVRDLATRGADLYVLTGPIFDGSSIGRINSRVFIPTHVFKAVFDAGEKKAAAYIAPNAPGMKYETVSIAELEGKIGINLFPKMAAQVKSVKMALPTPTPHGYQRSRRPR